MRKQLLRIWRVVRRHVQRTWSWRVDALELGVGEQARLQEQGIGDETARQYLVWRRSALLVAGLATGLSAVAHALVALELYLGLPLLWSDLGLFVQVVRIVALFALPVSAFIGFALWTRPRLSRTVVLAGWATAFLAPVLASFVPPHQLFNLDALSAGVQQNMLEDLSELLGVPIAAQPEHGHVHRTLLQLFDIAGGLVYGILLLPTILSLIPGAFRACLRIKVWLPESMLPGWSLVTSAPLYSFGFFVFLVAVNQVTGSRLLLCSGLLMAAAPLVYVARASLFLRPLARVPGSRHFRAVQMTYGIMVTLAVVLLCLNLGTVEFHLAGKPMRLVGLQEEASLLRPWDLMQFCAEYLGRACFVTVVVADLVLRMHCLAWGYAHEFASTASAGAYHEMMGRLSKATGNAGIIAAHAGENPATPPASA